MSTKGLQCSFHDMSQYKDQITGDIFCNTRVIDDKIIELTDQVSLSEVDQRGSRPTSEVTLFGDKVIVFGKGYGGYAYGFPRKKISGKITFSIWTYLPQDIINELLYFGIYTSQYRDRYENATVYYVYPWPIYENNRKFAIINTKYTGSNRDDRPSISTNTASIILNQWVHIAITCNNKNYIRIFVNGSKVFEVTNLTYSIENNYLYYNMYPVLQDIDNYKIYYTDCVLINDQILWDSNFTVPNDYLLGRNYRPKKISKKNILYPIATDRNDYFDKAYLY